MCDQEKKELVDQVFELTYAAMCKEFRLSKADIVEKCYSGDPVVSQIFHHLVSAGLDHYHLLPL